MIFLILKLFLCYNSCCIFCITHSNLKAFHFFSSLSRFLLHALFRFFRVYVYTFFHIVRKWEEEKNNIEKITTHIERRKKSNTGTSFFLCNFFIFFLWLLMQLFPSLLCISLNSLWYFHFLGARRGFAAENNMCNLFSENWKHW